MNIISFPIGKVEYSHDFKIFKNLGFNIVDTGSEGSYAILPEGWSADYQYHTPFEFYMIITDIKRRLRATAYFVGKTAKVELLPRYNIINYKPWLSPFKSELRLVDNANNRVLIAQSYLPKLIPNQTSTDLIVPNVENSIKYEDAYQTIIDFCIKNNIDINADNPTAYW